jgi:hypothetical protein
MTRSDVPCGKLMSMMIALIIAVSIEAAARAATNDYGGKDFITKVSARQSACALLTAADIAGVLGSSVTWSSAGTGGPDADTTCSYSTADNTDINLNLAGGRSEFNNLTSQLTGMTPLHGVGDAAFNGPNSTGGSGGGAQVFVLRGGTYFYITVQSERGERCRGRQGGRSLGAQSRQ